MHGIAALHTTSIYEANVFEVSAPQFLFELIRDHGPANPGTGH